MKQTRARTALDVAVIAVSAIALRVLFGFSYAPGWALDSQDYSWRWLILRNREWQNYDGYKPPGYSLFLGLAQWLAGAPGAMRLSYPAAQAAVWLQQLGGLAAAVMLYFLLRNIGVSRRAALIATIFFATLAVVCLFEVLILSLCLTAYLLIAALWLCSWALRRAAQGRPSYLLAAASGIAFSLATLVRAEICIFLIVLTFVGITASIFYRAVPEFRASRKVFIRTAASALPLIGGLISFNWIMLGQATLTTASPYASTSSVYNLFDRVESRDHVFGEIMVKYYKGPARIDLVNDAWPELSAHAAEMPLKRRGPWTAAPDLMAYAGEVSRRLQRRFPLMYLSNAAKSFERTFDFSQGRGLDKAPAGDPEAPDGKSLQKSKAGARIAEAVRAVQAPILLILYCLMLLLGPAVLVGALTSSLQPSLRLLFAFGLAVASATTLVAFGFAHTYFSHYGLIYFSCIVACSAVVFDEAARWLAARAKASSR